MTLPIEDGFPVPDGKEKYPTKSLKVGQSFFVHEGKLHSLQAQCAMWSRSLGNGKHFIARQAEGGVRVWRTE